MELKKGMVVLTTGNRHSLVSRLVAWSTGSWWTHAFLVTSEHLAVEAHNPRVRSMNIAERLQVLADNDQKYAVLDLPGITDEQRTLVAEKAVEYVGRSYGNIRSIVFGIARVFWPIKHRELICSDLITRAFEEGLGIRLFDLEKNILTKQYYRSHNLEAGMATPAEILQFSKLEILYTNAAETAA